MDWFIPAIGSLLLWGVHWQFFPLVFLFGFAAQIPNFIYPYVINKAKVSLAGTIF